MIQISIKRGFYEPHLVFLRKVFLLCVNLHMLRSLIFYFIETYTFNIKYKIFE